MGSLYVLVFCIFGVSTSVAYLNSKPFPPSFKFGVSTSAYQIEGAWNQGGRTPSVWDNFIHENPEKIANNDTGDVACDSYNKYEQDVDLLKSMGAQFYRLSISWTRILPYGTAQKINQEGVDYYVNLLKLLKENNIEPIVTLYHWDLPMPLQEMGGWTNPDIIKYFGDYARICYKEFGQYVKYWVTLNEPQTTCFYAYSDNPPHVHFAPAYSLDAEGTYLCAYTHVKAHALAYHIYDKEFREHQQGKISLSLLARWFEPKPNDPNGELAQELGMQFQLGLFAHPIYNGNWPQLIIDRVANRSSMQGLPQSRLPAFTKTEIDYINGTYDWFGLNYYITAMVELQYQEDDLPGNASYIVDQGFNSYTDSSWKANKCNSKMVQTPWGFKNLLKWVHDHYNQPEIIVTENGWCNHESSLNDTDRIEYVGLHLSAILDAIYDEGVNVTGYTQWSLLDNFEWLTGYSAKFGIVSVDFNDENRTRTPRDSFYWYRDVISTRILPNVSSGAIALQISLFNILVIITLIFI
ncbi:unnamed protein product [Ceutorhynchus assimilis]|uniref:Myrosinase 1-like n=1 Tax=Ceutorhynchus assimilis TaxID=467358 RepID=A0A9N9MVK2_9CUCU|nr:unnamed protein product [Ceutorhynchus assimilis]